MIPIFAHRESHIYVADSFGMYECINASFRDFYITFLYHLQGYTGNHIPIVRHVSLIKLPVGTFFPHAARDFVRA